MLATEAFGLHFPNPIGLAAGMDKYAEAIPAWEAIGMGFTELGAVTWHPQSGNSKPRVFRAAVDEALINRMGFNNPGANALARKLQEWRDLDRWPKHPVGINLGKSKITPLEDAAQDYADSFRELYSLVDFFVVNVSSPNTPNLRQLQDRAALDEILAALQEAKASLETRKRTTASTLHPRPANLNDYHKPVLVKIAPDLSFEAIDEILELAEPRNVAGIVATNTTITRPATKDAALRCLYDEAGGLSGRPLKTRSTKVIRHLYRQTNGQLPIIGVGGIFNSADAWEKITAGASLLQIYTGLIYEGPTLAKALVKGLIWRLKNAGLANLHDAVGINSRRD